MQSELDKKLTEDENVLETAAIKRSFVRYTKLVPCFQLYKQ